jgi:DNA-binding response OmpR family regulator
MMLARAEKRQPSVPYEPARLSRIVDVLVVHDDEPVRRFLEFHLRRAGYHVRLAASEMAASAHIFEAVPHVMVLDVDAPGMKCFEFLAGIRADPVIPFFPVIYLTADMSAAECIRELGAACVHKPIQPEKLLATVALSPLIRRPPSTAQPVSAPAANGGHCRGALRSRPH